MITISVCMIVKDEEAVLARCLEGVQGFADEIIVVDTGSKDRTKEIARTFTPKVYDFTWIDDFSAARNYSFSKATQDYCMWLDADDVILPEEGEKLRILKNTLDPSVDMVRMEYQTGFDEAGRPTFSYLRERLVKRSRGFSWVGAVHEVIPPEGKILDVKIPIAHKKERAGDPDRNLRIFERILERGGTLDARQSFYYARELYAHKQYSRAIDVLRDLLASGEGWRENLIEACRTLASCYAAQNQLDAAIRALFTSFLYDLPRAEVCCDLGGYLTQTGRLDLAVYWYQIALACEMHPENGGFVQPDCYGYLPCIWLCVLYDRLGDRKRAIIYNERAAQYKPEDYFVQQNRAYFAASQSEQEKEK